MVKIKDGTDYDRLDGILRAVVAEYGHRLDVTGWTRKTYDVYEGVGRKRPGALLVRVESFATTNGELTVFAEPGMALAEAIGTRLEQEFGIEEAVIVRGSAP